jgi:hypothetical protein
MRQHHRTPTANPNWHDNSLLFNHTSQTSRGYQDAPFSQGRAKD